MPASRSRASAALVFACSLAVVAACGGSNDASTSAADSSGTVVAPSGGHGGSGGSGGGALAGQGGSSASGHAGSGQSGSATGGKGGSGQSGYGGSGQSGSGQGGKGGTGQGGKAGNGQSGAGQSGSGGSQVSPVVDLEITPNTATITVTNGGSMPLQLEATPVHADGTIDPPVQASWGCDAGDMLAVSGSGVATATGARAGVANVTATWNGLLATAMIAVKFDLTYDPSNLPAADKMALDGATNPDTSSTWLYPYDATVFPQGLAAPVLMYDGGTANDEALVTIKSDTVDEKIYLTTSNGQLTLPQDAWTKLTESTLGGQATVTVARLVNGAATVLMSQTWTLASGSLRGTVYYWANSLGRVVRIKPGASAPDDFLAAAGVTDGCTTCHTVSANGNVLTIGGGTATGDSAASVFDLVGGQLVATDRGRAWAMPAVSPDGKFLVENNAPLPGPPGGSPGFFDVASGAPISGTGLDSAFLDMPAFAPDGSKLVYVDHGTHALGTYGYSEATGSPQVNGPMQLVAASGDPTNDAIAFPSVSPDGKWIVYAHSNLDTRNGPGDLYLANAETPGIEIRLDALDGTNYPFGAGDRDRHYNYEPTFAPLAAGGYYWVVFTSRRTYGNQLTGPAYCGSGCGTKQLWVAAIDQTPQAGKDPSHPAFWVPGQDVSTLNMRAFWSLDPCKADGDKCDTSSQCCGGVCLGDSTCGHPPNQTCSQVGDTCASAMDCCNFDKGYQCINSHCTEPKP